MAAKRFQPILNQIPEEETYLSNGNSIDIYQGLGSQRSGSAISLKRENSRKKTMSCVGCPGCQSDNGNDISNLLKYDIPACMNCMHGKGDKQSSIRQWLENIPNVKQSSQQNEFIITGNNNNLANSLMSLPLNEKQGSVRKQHSFSNTNSLRVKEHSTRPKRSSTMSVKSEPPLRNYNIPLPEFNTTDCTHSNFNYSSQTLSRIDDIKPTTHTEYRSGSLRNSAIANHRRKRHIITNNNGLPDMVNDTLDECSKAYNQSSSDDERCNNKNSDSAIINPYSRRSSESPLLNDYETDSLERSSHQKRISTPTDYPDVPSSQASPSLSNALPLEEELTMRNAVYKTHSSSNSDTPSPQRDICIEQNHYETIEIDKVVMPAVDNVSNKTGDYSLVSEVYVNNNYNFGSTPTSPSGSECSMGSRKLVTNINNNVEGKPGCLTIEVVDPPENYIKIHESDGFEPDTLDRKHPKHKDIVENIQFSRKDFINNLDNKTSPPHQRIQLRSSGTFKKINDKVEHVPKFNSLRNEFEYRKNIYDRPKLSPNVFTGTKPLLDTENVIDDTEDWTTEEGRILTLELRHSKRQRQCTPPTIKQLKSLARPDILPPLPPTEDAPIYEQPIFPPRKVEIENTSIDTNSKNVSGRSLSPRTFTKNSTIDSPSSVDMMSFETHYGPSCSPLRASCHSQISEYDKIDPVIKSKRTGEFCRNSNRRPSGRTSGKGINTNTFVKPSKEDQCKPRFRRRKGQSIEDSGYLSSDSTSSRQVQRKLIIPKIVSCSESDDTENEARSESGAESIETHSVYFGSFRKPQMDIENGHPSKSARDSGRKIMRSEDFV